jgi:hypothetical protein
MKHEKLSPREVKALEKIATTLTIAQLNRADGTILDVLGVIHRELLKRDRTRKRLRMHPLFAMARKSK